MTLLAHPYVVGTGAKIRRLHRSDCWHPAAGTLVPAATILTPQEIQATKPCEHCLREETKP